MGKVYKLILRLRKSVEDVISTWKPSTKNQYEKQPTLTPLPIASTSHTSQTNNRNTVTIITQNQSHMQTFTNTTTATKTLKGLNRWMISLFAIVLMITVTNVKAQTISSATYPFTTSSSVSLEDMSSGTTQLVAAGADDGGNTTLANIGFDFFYDGTRYSNFAASANGFIRLGAVIPGTDWTNAIATTTFVPCLATYWDDLWTGTDGKVHYKVIGSAPNRKMIVEWKNMNIPRGGSATAGGGTFQAWLYESTGVIEYVYGTGMAVNTANSGASIGLTTSATVFASATLNATSTSSTCAYGVANDGNTIAITAGTKFTFTPRTTLADPTGLTFASVSAGGMTLNWTASSPTTNVVKYAIYQSTDGGTTYNFFNTTNVGTNTLAVTGLTPSTTYFWKVYAISEGALSASPASNSQATPAAATYYYVGGASGDIGTAANWNTAADGSGTTRTSAQTTDILIVDGQGNTPGSGTPVTLTMAAATSIGALQITSSTAVTLTSSTTTTRALTLTGTTTGNTLDIPSGSSLILNSATNAATIAFSGTNSTGNVAGTLTFAGSTSNNLTTTGGTGTLVTVQSTGIVNNGVTAASGTFTGSAATLSFAGGSTLNVSGATTGAPALPLATWATTSNIVITGITTSTSAPTNNAQSFGNLTYNCTAASATMSFWATTTTAVIKGDLTITSTGTGIFRALTTGTLTVNGNVIANGGTFQSASSTGTLIVLGNTTIGASGKIDINAGTYSERGTTFTNNGTLTGVSSASTLQFFSPTSAAQTYTGTGTVTTNVGSISVQDGGLTISTTNQTPILRANLFIGAVTGAGKLTIGTGAALATTVQIGSTGLTTSGGSFDANPVMNLGTGTYTVLYQFETTARTTGFEIPTTRVVSAATIGNPNNVTVAGGNLGIGTLTLQSGNLITTSSNLVTITGTTTASTVRSTYTSAASASSSGTTVTVTSTTNLLVGMNVTVSAGTGTFAAGTTVTSVTNSTTFVVSATPTVALSGATVAGVGGWVSGPMAITLPVSLVTGSTYTLPVGKGSYNPFQLVNPTTNAGAGGVIVNAEVFDANSGGTPGTLMSSINTTRYWAASLNGTTAANFTNSFIKLNDTKGLQDAIGASSTVNGAYNHIGAVVSVTTATSIQSATTPETSLVGFYLMGNLAAATLSNLAISPTGNQCTNVPRTVTVTATPGGAAVTGVTINYTVNGGSVQTVNMTNLTNIGGLNADNWSGVIPTVTPANGVVAWSVTATDANSLVKTQSGPSYQDAPFTGQSVTVAASPATICTGTASTLTATTSGFPLGTKITEITQNYVGSFTNASPPAYLSFNVGTGNDLVELSNLGAFTETLNGVTLERWSTSTSTADVIYSFPSGVSLTPGQTAVISFGTGTNDLVNHLFYTGTPGFDVLSSSSLAGYIIKTGSTVKDAVAVNSYSFPSASLVTSGDWSGNIASMSGIAGSILTGADNNTASNWVVANAGRLISFGVLNTGLSASGSYTLTWATVPSSAFTASGLTASTGPLTAQTDFNINITDNTTGCVLTAATNATVAIYTPITPPAPHTSTQCGEGIPGAFVTGGTPGQYRWYTAAAPGGVLLADGVNGALTTTSISSTTTYYVSINDGTCESTRSAVVATVNQPDPIDAQVDHSSLCLNDAGGINLSAVQTGTTNVYSFTWSTSGGANAALGATGTQNTTAAPTAAGTYRYYVTAVDASAGPGPLTCTTSDSVDVVVNPHPVITTATASPSTICNGMSSTLNGTSLAQVSGILQVGNGNFGNSSTTYPAPFGNWFGGAKEQELITAAELTAAGLVAGNLTSLAYDVITPVTTTLQNFNIQIQNTTLTTLAALTMVNSGGSVVRNAANYTPSATAGFAANTINFDTPFFWDGTSNILVTTCFANPSFTNNAVFRISSTTNVASQVYFADLTTVCSAPSSAASGGTFGRPNMRFGGQTIANHTSLYTWTWNPGSLTGSTQTVSPSATTTYTVRATDGTTGCYTEQNVILTVNDLPTAPTATNSNQCGSFVPTASVTSTTSQVSPKFSWYLGATGGSAVQTSTSTTFTNTVTTTTTFYVTEVDNTTFCESSPRTAVVVTVNTPDSVYAWASTPRCVNTAITLSANQVGNNNSYVFTWTAIPASTESGLPTSMDGQSISVTPTVAGTYTYHLSAYDSDLTCSFTYDTVVVVSGLPIITTATATPSSVCSGGLVTLNGSSISSTSFNIGEVSDPSGVLSALSGYGMYFSTTTATTINTVDIYPAAAGTLTVELHNDLNAVVGSQNFTILAGDISTTVKKTLTLNFSVPAGSTGWQLFYSSLTINRGASSYSYPYTSNGFTITGNTLDGNNITGGTRFYFYNWNVTVSTDNSGSYTWQWNPGAITGPSATTNPTTMTTTTINYNLTATNAAGCTLTSANIPVVVNALPDAPGTTPSTQCGVGTPGVSASGASAGQYRWYTVSSGGTAIAGETNATLSTAVTISTPTTYYVAINNGTCEGPRSSVFADVTTPPTVAITPGGTTTFCSGGSVSLDASQAPTDPSYNSFTWAPATGLNSTTGAVVTASPTVTTTYTVTATNPAGCSNTAQITITVNPNPVISSATASPATICSGGSSTLAGTSVGIGTGTVQIGSGTTPNSSTTTIGAFYGTWYGNGHAQILIKGTELASAGFAAGAPLTALSIDVSATSTTDPIVNAFTISLASVPVTTSSITTFQSPTFTTVYGPTNYTPVVGTNTHTFTSGYTWDGTSNIIVDYCYANGVVGNGAAINTTTSTSFGSFVNFQEDGSVGSLCGLTTVSNTSTSRPNIQFTGQITTDVTGNYNWLWNPGALAGSSVSVSPTAPTTTYTVTATDPVTGCNSTSGPVTVTVTTVGGAPTATPATICAGASSTLDANPSGGSPFTYLWSTGATTRTISVSPAVTTTYTVVVTDACGNPTSTLSVTVTVNPLPTVSIAESGPISICNPSTQVLHAVTAAVSPTYQWSLNGVAIGGATSSTYTVSGVGTGSYTVVVQEHGTSTACFSNASAAVSVTINPKPTAVSVTPPTATICVGSSVALSASGGTIPSIGTIGTGTVVNSITTYPTPFGQFYGSDHMQMLVPATELTASGLSGGVLTSLAFDQPTGYTFVALQNFRIAIAQTAQTALTTTLISTGFTTVFGPQTYTPSASTGYSTIPFASNFNWDGTSNIVVDIWFSNCSVCNGTSSCTTSFTDNGVVNQSNTSYVSTYDAHADDNCTINSFAIGGTPIVTTFSQRPNMKFGGVASTTVTWDNAGTLNTASGNNVIASPTTTTTYTATATSAFGCTNSGQAVVTVNPLPTVSYTGLPANGTICDAAYTLTGNHAPAGTFTIVGSSAGFTDNANGTASFNPATAGAGTYTIRYHYTNGNGCTDSASHTVVVSTICTSTVSLKAYIQGYYDADLHIMRPVLMTQGHGASTTVADSIDVDLRNGTYPYAVVATVRAPLNTDGTASLVYPSVSGSYFICVRGRNIVETWSAAAVAIGATGSYDFTSGMGQAYGTNAMYSTDGIFAIYSGDIDPDKDGNVDILDFFQLAPGIDVNNGYFPEDINGDGNVDILDFFMLAPNIDAVNSQHPAHP